MTTAIRKALRDQRAVVDGEQDAGIAMVMVLLIMITVTIIIVALMSMSLSGMVQARARQDSPASLEAAQAGVDDFLTRLNQSPINFVPTVATDPALGGWVNVSGASNGAEYRYWLDNSISATSGRVTVVSSGRVNGKVRTLRAALKVNSFADYLYFTNLETRDPALGGAATCNHYAWQSSRNSSCNIYFRGGGGVTDQLDGKVFSNDTIAISGSPIFGDTVETGAATGAWNTDGTAAPIFNGTPATTQHAALQALPAGNAQLKTDASTSFAGKKGCVFYGPTEIRLVAAVGATPAHMMITSPNTTTAESPASLGCGTWPATVEQSVPMPGNGIAYVANMPAGSPGTCLKQFESQLSSGLTGDTASAGYGCTDGDAFVHGTNGGQITIGSDNDIYLTNNLLNDGQATTIAGLIANNFIWLWHPVNGSGTNLTHTELEDGVNVTSPPTSIEVDALMLADTDSIVAQNYASGAPMGTFKVVGGLIQNYRGTVGTIGSPGTGYTKLYTYDARLRGLIPPHFAQPGNITWGRDSITEDTARSS